MSPAAAAVEAEAAAHDAVRRVARCAAVRSVRLSCDVGDPAHSMEVKPGKDGGAWQRLCIVPLESQKGD
jgi:hypothetical protein